MENQTFEYNPSKYVMSNLPDSLVEEDLNKILIYAIKNNASDIFFKTDDVIRSDIYGWKYKLSNRKLSSSEISRFIIKIYGGETAISILGGGKAINDVYVVKYLPDATPDNSKPVMEKLRFRINITPVSASNITGYEITARSIPSKPPSLDKKEVPQEVIDAFNYPNGINLVIGATGSGKSTLLAGIILDKIRNKNISKRILSFEAPIEFSFDDVKQVSTFITQIEIPKMLPNFYSGIEEALRKKPDDIFVGEMRDPQTITNAILASQMGHLVYSTIHVNSVAETISRIANNFSIDEKRSKVADIIASSRIMLAQRLRPTLDGKRCAIREYLLFNDDIRTYLNSQDLDKISEHLEKMVWEHGVPFAVHARQRFLEKKISIETYHEFLAGKNLSDDFLDEKIKILKSKGNVMFQNNNF